MFPQFGILHRMIFWELVRVFLLTLTGLTGLFLLGLVVQQASQLGLSPAQTLAIVPLLVPMTLPFTIPSTTLFASCVVYGRLSADNEAVAMKAGGVDLYTILRPALLLGFLTTATTAGLYYSFIPRTQTMIQDQVLQDPEEVLYNKLKRDRRFNPSNFPYAIFVRDVQGRRLIDVVIKKRGYKKDEKTGITYPWGYDFVARAQEARLIVDMEKKELAIDPNRWVFWGKDTNAMLDGAKPLQVPLPEDFTNNNAKSRPTAMDWDILPERAKELREKQVEIERKRESSNKAAEAISDPIQRANQIKIQNLSFDNEVAEAERQIRSALFEHQMRPALAVGCLCFAVIGCPVGIWANRADYLSTFVTCFLPTVFAYYPLLLAGGGLGRDGKVPLAVGVWAANAFAGLAALVLTWRLIRR